MSKWVCTSLCRIRQAIKKLKLMWVLVSWKKHRNDSHDKWKHGHTMATNSCAEDSAQAQAQNTLHVFRGVQRRVQEGTNQINCILSIGPLWRWRQQQPFQFSVQLHRGTGTHWGRQWGRVCPPPPALCWIRSGHKNGNIHFCLEFSPVFAPFAQFNFTRFSVNKQSISKKNEKEVEKNKARRRVLIWSLKDDRKEEELEKEERHGCLGAPFCLQYHISASKVFSSVGSREELEN